ncbi:DUF551 domain-containing protein [Raoultella ornithinolytica]|uniref:DUF551 domain-containing protein n=1 Tax=Raoultella ornithinolytica TaxID=54291 RepID=A0A9Q9JKS2_RAOOR|nr:DUF551 domain-containing protein [Raoultella ornithinolytica]UXE40648.1 DUF551 domain-containing protein [Raoultella ornithinolytica]
MTKSTITRERLEEIVSDPMINQGSEFAMLARMALAGMEAEPVAWHIHIPLTDCVYVEVDAETVGRVRAGCEKHNHAVNITPLYTAPQPLTTSERSGLENYRNAQPDMNYQHLSELYHAQEKRLFKLAQRIKGPAFDKYAHSPSQAIDVLESVVFGESEAVCRAAMLQGAENTESRVSTQTAPALEYPTNNAESHCGNSPVIPDGWVMVPVQDEFLSAEQNASGMFELSEDCMCRLAVALSQQSKGLVTPLGYVMVPKEPTEDMCFAPDVRVGNKTWDGYQSSADMAECKAIYEAMLAAAPHNTPALNSLQSVDSVADRWIPVSERMPDVGVKVLCFPVKDEPIHAIFNGRLWLQDVSWSGSYDQIDNVIPVSVTHWMPLPAAPQEVSNEK